MKVLILDMSTQIREAFITALLPAGYEVSAIKDKKELIPALSTKRYDIAVLDVNENDKEMMQLIKIIRTNPRFESIKLIAHISSPSKQFIVETLKLGIAGYMLKPFLERGLLERFQAILQKANINISNEKRKHVRVKPDEKDEITVTFRSPTSHRLISGRVVDISAGGAAFVLFGTVQEDEAQMRQFLNNFQVQFNRVRVSSPALIIARKDKLCAVQFYKMQDYDMNLLCKYIYDRLENTSAPVPPPAQPVVDISDEANEDEPDN